MAKIRQFSALILFALVLMVKGNVVKAQETWYVEDERTFYAGVLAGANFTQVDGDDFRGYHKVGVNVGGIAYARLADHLAASMEILFSQKGAKGNLPTGLLANIDGSSIKQSVTMNNYRLNLNYAEVPILINYFDKRKSHFGGGFSYSQLVSSTEKFTTDVPLNPPYNQYDYPMKKMDINMVLSGNLHLWHGIFLNLRFQYSLLTIRSKVDANLGRSNQQYNKYFTLRLMYLFI
jgi:hypothetical protein